MGSKEPQRARFKYRSRAHNIRFKVEDVPEKSIEREISDLSQPISKPKTGGFRRGIENASIGTDGFRRGGSDAILLDVNKKVKKPSKVNRISGVQEVLESNGNTESTADILSSYIKSSPMVEGGDDSTASESHTVVKMKLKRMKRRKIIKPKEIENEDETVVVLPKTWKSNRDIQLHPRWYNIRRVLIFATRGISPRDRHLMNDIRRLLPHSRTESKLERQTNLHIINEVCEVRNCGKCMLFEGRCSSFSYVWLSNVPEGPSAKFLLQNVHTMDELRFTGNCLLASRPLLSFDETFDKYHHYSIIKELLVQIFGVSNNHPKSQPFYDRVFLFSLVDSRIWFRNFQILAEGGGIVEIGPRFVMNPVKIFGGSFGGETLWENSKFETPVKLKQLKKISQCGMYVNQVNQKMWDLRTPDLVSYSLPDEIFTGNPLEKAKEIVLGSSSATRKNETQDLGEPENEQVGKKKLTRRELISLKRKAKQLKANLKREPELETNMERKIGKRERIKMEKIRLQQRRNGVRKRRKHN